MNLNIILLRTRLPLLIQAHKGIQQNISNSLLCANCVLEPQKAGMTQVYTREILNGSFWWKSLFVNTVNWSLELKLNFVHCLHEPETRVRNMHTRPAQTT